MKHKKNSWLWLFVFSSCFALGAFAAEERHLYFWPTEVISSDPHRDGTLFSWPQYKVLLHTKKENSYVVAQINDEFAKRLSQQFKPKNDSPISVFHEPRAQEWGLMVASGSLLRKENLLLLPAFAEKFVDCLRTLSASELDLIKNVIYSPLSLMSSDGQLLITEEHKAIAALMSQRFQDRCVDGKAVVPELLRQKVGKFLTVFLSGTG